MPKDLAKLGRPIAGLFEGHEQGQGTDVIEVKGLTVRFSGVIPIDDMSVTFPAAPAA